MTRKQPAAPKAKKSAQQNSYTSDEIRQMIAEAAYYHAEHRGFQGGNTEQDWLQAENEINALIAN